MNFEESVWLLREIQKNGVGFVPQKMRNFEVSQTDSTSIGIKMLEPADTVIEGQTIVPIVGVKVLMRTDRYPENPFDGDVVLNNTEIGKYEEEPFIIPDLVQGTTYYFTAYPYSVNDVYDLTNSTEDRAELELAFDERVTITSVVDEPTLFPYANIVVHDITDGTEQTKHVDANSSVEFIVPIYHEYYVSSDPVVDFSYPADTEHFNAVGNGVNNLTFEYLYAKNVIDVNVSADSDTGFFSTLEVEVTAHNVTDGTDYTITRIGGGNYRFPAENGKEYYISYGVVPGYGSPDNSEQFTIVKDVVKSITAQYVYDVETINVTVEAGDGSDMTGAVITLYNVTDSTEESKTWSGTTLTFFVRSGKSYYVNGDIVNDRYFTSKTEERTAAVGVIYNVTMTYKKAGSLEECTWEEIKMISDSGNAEKVFSIGDTKTIVVSYETPYEGNSDEAWEYDDQIQYHKDYTGDEAMVVKILDFDYGGIVFGIKRVWRDTSSYLIPNYGWICGGGLGVGFYGGGFPLTNVLSHTGKNYTSSIPVIKGPLVQIRNLEAGRTNTQALMLDENENKIVYNYAQYIIAPPNQTNDDRIWPDHYFSGSRYTYDNNPDFFKNMKSVKRKYYYILYDDKEEYKNGKHTYVKSNGYDRFGLEVGAHVCEVESKIWPLTAEDLGYSAPPKDFKGDIIPPKRLRGFTDDDSILVSLNREHYGIDTCNAGFILANPYERKYIADPNSNSSSTTLYIPSILMASVFLPCNHDTTPYNTSGFPNKFFEKSLNAGEKGYNDYNNNIYYSDPQLRKFYGDYADYYWCFVV